MSLVGPRPCIPYEYEPFHRWQKTRVDARPGLTGLWQVNGKNRTTFLEMLRLDIRYARDMWNIDGVTSNPRHVRNSGKPFLVAIRDIAKEFDGLDRAISVEVSPHHTTAEAMVEEGLKLAPMSPNFVIKIPATEPGFKALWLLKDKGMEE